MKYALLEGVNIFLKEKFFVKKFKEDGTEYLPREFPCCKSEKFIDLRKVLFDIFEALKKGLDANDLDATASVAFTMSALFENAENENENTQELVWKENIYNSLGYVKHKNMFYNYHVNCETNCQNYVVLECTLWLVFRSDIDPHLVDVYNQTIDKFMQNYTPYYCVRDKEVYLGFVNKFESGKSEKEYSKILGYAKVTGPYEHKDGPYTALKEFLFKKEIDEEFSHKTFNELYLNMLSPKTDNNPPVEDTNTYTDKYNSFDEDLYLEIEKFFYNQFRFVSNKVFPCIITFEGLAGCGRSTMARLRAEHYDYFRTRTQGVDPETGKHILQPKYIEIDASTPISGVGDCVVFINHAERYVDDSDLRDKFIQAAKGCKERCLIILSASSGSIAELLNSSDTLRGMISRRFTFKNYTVNMEIKVLEYILNSTYRSYLFGTEKFAADNEKKRECLRDLMLKAAHLPVEESNEGKYDVSVGGELANGYFAARLAERLVRGNFPVVIGLDTVEAVCKDLEKEFDETGMVLTSQIVEKKDRANKKLTLDNDVIGNKAAKDELRRCIEWLKTDEPGMRAICLAGEPGCGKTHMARVVASETDAKFVARAGNEFIQRFSGQGAVALGELFDRIDGYKRCVLFIDEVDAIGRARGSSGGETLGDQALNKLLTRLDGFETRSNKLMLITATNCYDMLDPALKRRLGTCINIRLPEHDDRLEMLNYCLKSLPEGFALEIDDKAKSRLATEMEGMSFDKIKKIVVNVVDRLRNTDDKKITEDVLNEQIAIEILGPVKQDDNRTRDTLERIAVHELGHAAAALIYGRSVAYCTIEAREGGAGGYTKMSPNNVEGLPLTSTQLSKEVCIALGGRAAEEVFYGDVSDGCSGDISHASNLLRTAYAQGGLGDFLIVRDVNSPEVLEKAEVKCQELYNEIKKMFEDGGFVNKIKGSENGQVSVLEKLVQNKIVFFKKKILE